MIKLTVNVTDANDSVREPVFVEDAKEIAKMVQQAVSGFIEAHRGALELPLRMEVTVSPEECA